MKDFEIQKILLEEYYKRRRDNWIQLLSKDVNNKITDEDILRVSEQLFRKGYLEWDSVRDETGEIVTGHGQISSFGIEYFEREPSVENEELKIGSKREKIILDKLEKLLDDPLVKDELESKDDLMIWSSKVAPLLQFNPQYQSKFLSYQEVAVLAQLKLQTRQAFQIMKSQVVMAIGELKLINDLESSNCDDEIREKLFPKGFYYDASIALGNIIKSAKVSIYLIDNFIDENILNFFTIKEDAVVLRIISKEIKDVVKQFAKQFNRQYGKLEIHISNDYHDRFLIIDEKTFFHFGASLKDLGKKMFMFSEIEENENRKILFEKWQKDWLTSIQVI